MALSAIPVWRRSAFVIACEIISWITLDSHHEFGLLIYYAKTSIELILQSKALFSRSYQLDAAKSFEKRIVNTAVTYFEHN